VIAGSVLLVLSVLVGIVGTSLTLGRVDFQEFSRDVVIPGPDAVLIPGRIEFSVDEPLGSGSGAMTVGVATTSTGVPVPTCTLSTAAGRDIRLSNAGIDDTLVNDTGGRYRVVGRSRLEPGDYVAECRVAGEPSQATRSGEFTVGRTLGADEMGQVLRPFFWFVGVVGVAGLMFVVGLVMLIVGLVMRSRSRRDGVAGAPAPWAQGWPPPAGPVPWGPDGGSVAQPPPGYTGPQGYPDPPTVPPAAPEPTAPAPAPWTTPPTGPPLGPPPASPPTGPDSGWPTQPGRR
jgi:hypothetical protein